MIRDRVVTEVRRVTTSSEFDRDDNIICDGNRNQRLLYEAGIRRRQRQTGAERLR